jgi:hypothetical protein
MKGLSSGVYTVVWALALPVFSAASYAAPAPELSVIVTPACVGAAEYLTVA